MVKKEKNKFFVWVSILLVFGFLLFLFSIFYNQNKVLEETEIYAIVEITERAGVAVNGTALIFGRLTHGTSSFKNLTFSNHYNFPIYAELSVKGNISDFLLYDSFIYLDSGEQKNITINTIKISEDIPYGIYDGKVIVSFKKAVGSQ